MPAQTSDLLVLGDVEGARRTGELAESDRDALDAIAQDEQRELQ